MPGVSDLRKELKELRKASKAHIAVSRMKKEDISAEIQRLKGAREETPAVAAVPSAPPRRMETDVMTIKEARAKEFPLKPAKNDKLRDVSTKVAKKEPAPKKKLSKMERLMEMFRAQEV
jgi:hypothetical protein